MIPEIGRRFGPYEILGRLGGGGMGHVFRGWDARLHREVAIKFLHNEYAMPGMRERFLREARAASALNHPNICTVFDIGEQDGDPYLVMELLEGETLKDRIDKRAIQLDEMLCVGKEAAEALGAAHAKGVIHRDIKPANIFLVQKPNAGFQVKVLDFGLAKIEGGVLGARQSRSLDITTAGSTVGTLAYMSPEQARGEVLDSRSDLFSLGVVMYEMATRQIPFPGATSALVFVKLLNHAPEPVREWNDAVPRDLDKIILKLMAKERTARFQTAHELYEALCKVGERGDKGGWLRKAVTASVPGGRTPEPLVRERKSPRRKQSDPAVAVPLPPQAQTAVATPQPANNQPQFLRPVARVPRGDATPRPSTEVTPDKLVPEEAAATPAAETSASRESRPGPSARQASASAQALAVATNPAAAPPVQGLSSAEFATPFQAEPPPKRIRVRFNLTWLIGGLVLLIVLAVIAVLIANRGHFGPTMLTERDSVVLTEIENRTGDKSLDGSVQEALQIALAQSPYLLLRSPDAFRMARRQAALEASDTSAQVLAHNVAQRLGTRAYFFGFIKGTQAPYTIHVDLLNTATNDVMSSQEEHVPSLQEIPAAVDRLSDAIRANVGEDNDSIGRTHVPLSREATSNLDALHAFAQAEDARAAGRNLDAIDLYQQAAALEPRFVLAYLRMTVLYRKQRAELAAATSARLALSAADNVSERTRTFAQYEYEMNASGDYLRAAGIIRGLVTNNPHDSEALEALARVLRLLGRMAESLQTAQLAYTLDPLNTDAYTQADNALIGLDRYDASFQLQGQEQRLGIARAGGILTSAYLAGRQDAVDSAAAALAAHQGPYRPDWNYGLYLDNIGQLNAGVQLWRRNAQAALQVKGMESAAAFLLSQGALDHALLGDCTIAMQLAQEASGSPRGMMALFNTGMTDALCGDEDAARAAANTLQNTYPQSFAVNSFYLADIHAAIALQDNDPAAALEVLKPARQFDLISLTPFLRGRAHVALRQGQIGIVDYQTVLAHRGVTFIVGSNVYPAAEVGVARAFADTGDLNNSAGAYRRFLDLWKSADPAQPLLQEARSHLK